jgi:hypothetical protein
MGVYGIHNVALTSATTIARFGGASALHRSTYDHATGNAGAAGPARRFVARRRALGPIRERRVAELHFGGDDRIAPGIGGLIRKAIAAGIGVHAAGPCAPHNRSSLRTGDHSS